MRRVLLVLLLGCAPSLWAGNATVAPGSHVNLRAGKTESLRVLRVLPPGTPVEVLETEGQVARVRTETGETGWLPLRLLVPAPEPPPVAKPTAESTPPAAPAAPAPEPAPPAAAPQASAGAFPWAWVAGGLGFLLGAVVGIAAHEAYYRKRLNGLRI